MSDMPVSDPLIAAIAVTLEEVLRRGLSVQPTDTGWVIRLEAEESEPQGVVRRSW